MAFLVRIVRRSVVVTIFIGNLTEKKHDLRFCYFCHIENGIDHCLLCCYLLYYTHEKKEPFNPHLPASYLRKTFTAVPGEKNRLYITSRGIYQAYLNGKPVGEQVFAPGPAVYDQYIPVQTYDVDALLNEGENELLVVLGDGWYRSCSGVNGDRNLYGSQLGLVCQLMADGEIVCATDETWQASQQGPIRQNDLQQGEAWLYLLIMFFFQTIQSIGALSYYFKYIVGDVGAAGLLSIMSFVLLPTMFLFPVLMKKLSASQIIALGAVFSCLGYIVNYFAGASMTMLMIGGIITAFAMLPVSYLGNMVQMDLCSYNQYLGLPRMDASIGALFNGFGTQLGQGFGGWLLGFALTAAGYVASEGDAVVAQPESAITMIRMLYSLIPLALMAMLAVVAFSLSKLNKKMPEIEAKIAADNAQKV